MPRANPNHSLRPVPLPLLSPIWAVRALDGRPTIEIDASLELIDPAPVGADRARRRERKE